MKNSLLKTNIYLKNLPAKNKALARNITSSSAIEGIHVVLDAKTGRFLSQIKPKSTKSVVNPQ